MTGDRWCCYVEQSWNGEPHFSLWSSSSSYQRLYGKIRRQSHFFYSYCFRIADPSGRVRGTFLDGKYTKANP